MKFHKCLLKKPIEKNLHSKSLNATTITFIIDICKKNYDFFNNYRRVNHK